MQKPTAAVLTRSPGISCRAIESLEALPTLADDVRNGLLSPPRSLPPKYFYDERGSSLFDRICDRPEYYPTRTEDALLEKHALELIDVTRPTRIVELGSGTARKTRRLFDACGRTACFPRYAPVDVCGETLVETGQDLLDEYEWLEIDAYVGDYVGGLHSLSESQDRDLFVFLGGTIGNFEHDAAARFLSQIRTIMGREDRLLLGVDRVKDPRVLHAAYNDAGGLTRAFNLNVLNVLNRELEANFALDGFDHYAYFNPKESRIEMHLIAIRDQTVTIKALNEVLHLREGDSILTEVSCKYTRAGLEALLEASGFTIARHYEPDNRYFSLVVAAPAA